MKVLIVDDEKHVREAIRLLTDWGSLDIQDILEADHGEAAIRLLQEEEPEIVLTDMMMPLMNGVDLLEWIHSHAPRTKTVVISGHDDFDLVRNTVKYGGLDYLLKPIDPEELQAAVAKAVHQRRQDDAARDRNQRQAIEMNQIRPVYWERMFSSLLEDPGYWDQIRAQAAPEFHIPMDTRTCTIAILTVEPVPEVIRRKFAAGQDLLVFALANICNEYLHKEHVGYAFRHWHGVSQVVLLLWNNLHQAEELLHRINQGIDQSLGGKFHIGLGRVMAFPSGVASSYSSAMEALRSRNIRDASSWIHTLPAVSIHAPGSGIPEESIVQIAPILRFTDYEANLRLAIRSGVEERIRDALEPWFAAVEALPVITPRQLEQWQQEYDILWERWSKECLSADQLLASQEEKAAAEASWQLANNPFEMNLWKKTWTRGLLQLTGSGRRQQEEHVIFEIARFIEAHYQEDINLQDIANRFFLSREYISRKFKQEFKENLSDYVGRIRIEKAKVLLSNPRLRLAEVAESVGYQDDKYFSKVFKKITGYSPGEYRKLSQSAGEVNDHEA